MSDTSCIRRLVSRFWSDRSASIAVTSCASVAVLALVAAVSIEGGRLFIEKRKQQSANDLAAIAAASNPTNALAAASASLRANGIDPSTITSLQLGSYVADTSIPVASRFVAGGSTGTVAADLKLARRVPLIFGAIIENAIGAPDVEIASSATGASSAQAAFSIGSRLASLNGGVANALLGGLLGANVSLTAMDYTSLASANVEIFGYYDALATRAALKAVTYSDVAKSSVDLPSALQAIADMQSVDAAARSAVATLRTQLSGAARQVKLDSWISLGNSGDRALGAGGTAPITMSVLDLVSAMARIAGANRLVEFDLTANLPTGTSAKVSLAIGEPMQNSGFVAMGAPGATIRTAQTRFLLVLQQSLAGVGSISVPVYLEIASGVATLGAVSCGSAPSATLSVTPALAEAWIADTVPADLTNFSRHPGSNPASLLKLGALRVTATAHAAASNLQPTAVSFSAQEISSHTLKSVSTQQALTTLLASLAGNLSVNVAGVSLLGGATSSTVSNALRTTLPALDGAVSGVLMIVGIKIGEADVKVTGTRCGGGVLVR